MTGHLLIYMVSAWKRWLNLNSCVPAVNLNLREPDGTSLHTLQCSAIISRILAALSSVLGLSVRRRSVFNALTDWCPNVRWIVLSFCWVERATGMSSGVHRCMKKYFFLVSGWRLVPRLTSRPCINISNPLSNMYFIERRVGISPSILKMKHRSQHLTVLSGTGMRTTPAASPFPPLPAIDRLSVGCIERGRLNV